MSSFQGRDTKLYRFLAKNHHTQKKLLYFVNSYRNPTIFNTYNTLGRWVDWMNDSSTKRLIFQALFLFQNFSCTFGTQNHFIFVNLWEFFLKKKWNNFCKEFWKKLWKKMILGTSDTWLMRRSSQPPGKPANYIEDLWIFVRSCQKVTKSDFSKSIFNVKKSFCNWHFLKHFV